jgi:DNA-binding CsgD family transcriptional regulator
MKFRRVSLSLSLFFIICFKSLTLIFIGKSLVIVFVFWVVDYFRGRSHRSTVQNLKRELSRSRLYLISDSNPFVDIDDMDLTESEYEVLEFICLNSSTNKELCKRFGKSLSTIKSQLKSIMDKAGVDNRYDLIALCRSNFT